MPINVWRQNVVLITRQGEGPSYQIQKHLPKLLFDLQIVHTVEKRSNFPAVQLLVLLILLLC